MDVVVQRQGKQIEDARADFQENLGHLDVTQVVQRL
jgi:hypothetical protein